jgi:hypothetical protein
MSMKCRYDVAAGAAGFAAHSWANEQAHALRSAADVVRYNHPITIDLRWVSDIVPDGEVHGPIGKQEAEREYVAGCWLVTSCIDHDLEGYSTGRKMAAATSLAEGFARTAANKRYILERR